MKSWQEIEIERTIIAHRNNSSVHACNHSGHSPHSSSLLPLVWPSVGFSGGVAAPVAGVSTVTRVFSPLFSTFECASTPSEPPSPGFGSTSTPSKSPSSAFNSTSTPSELPSSPGTWTGAGATASGSCTTGLSTLLKFAPDEGRRLFFSPFLLFLLFAFLLAFLDLFGAPLGPVSGVSPSSSLSTAEDPPSSSGVPGPEEDIVEAVLSSRRWSRRNAGLVAVSSVSSPPGVALDPSTVLPLSPSCCGVGSPTVPCGSALLPCAAADPSVSVDDTAVSPALFASVAFGDSDSPSFGGMTGASSEAGVDSLFAVESFSGTGGGGGVSEEGGAGAGSLLGSGSATTFAGVVCCAGVESAPLEVAAEVVVLSPEASGSAAPSTSSLFLLVSTTLGATGLSPVASPDAPANPSAGEVAAVPAVF
ncbi:hypothetical protein BJV78DRAFT_916963 [Lactifluus subvellereus]|nr:hypothetical protein BJV78DRAFT_916963 [Lactifluus subvellereus]